MNDDRDAFAPVHQHTIRSSSADYSLQLLRLLLHQKRKEMAHKVGVAGVIKGYTLDEGCGRCEGVRVAALGLSFFAAVDLCGGS